MAWRAWCVSRAWPGRPANRARSGPHRPAGAPHGLGCRNVDAGRRLLQCAHGKRRHTGCPHRLLALRHHVAKHRQHAARHLLEQVAPAVGRGGFAGGAHQQQALKTQCGHGLFVQVGQPTLHRLGQPPLGVGQHHGQGVYARSAQPGGQRQQVGRPGHPQGALPVVIQARGVKHHQRHVGPQVWPLARRGALGQHGGADVAQAHGERLAHQHLGVAVTLRGHQPGQQFGAQHAGATGHHQQGLGWRTARGGRAAGRLQCVQRGQVVRWAHAIYYGIDS